jgi:hypothetical protein
MDWSSRGATLEPQPDSIPDVIPAGTHLTVPHYKDGVITNHDVIIEEDMPKEEAQKFIDQELPRTMGDIIDQIQRSTTPVSREDYEMVKQEGLLGKGNEDKRSAIQQFYDTAAAGAGGLLRGLGSTSVNALSLIKDTIDLPFSSNEEDAAKNKQDLENSYKALVEGGAKGTVDLYQILQLGISKVASDDYNSYLQLKRFQKYDEEMKAGKPLVFDETLSPELVKEREDISYFLDVTLIGGGAVLKSILSPVKAGLKAGLKEGAKITLEQAAKQAAKPTVANAVASKLLYGAGATLEAPLDVTKWAYKKAGEVLGESGKKAAATGVKAGAAGAATYGVLTSEDPMGWIGKGVGILTLAGLGRMLKVGAMIHGSKRAASAILKEAVENGAKKEVVPRWAIRLGSQVPDSVARVSRHMVDGMAYGAVFAGGAAYLQTASDPTSSASDIFQNTLASAIGGTVPGSIAGIGGGVLPELTGKAAKDSFLREQMFDLMERPADRKVEVMGQEIFVPGERDNRMAVMENKDWSLAEKNRIFNIARSAELAGNEVLFINNKTQLPGMTGENMGAGVTMIGTDPSKKPVIMLNVDNVTTPRAAIEEVAHAMISDAQAKEFLNELSTKAGSPEQALKEISEGLGKEYLEATRKVDPNRAADMQKDLDFANDPTKPVEERMEKALYMAHEYIARGIVERFQSKLPSELLTGETTPILSKAWNKVTTTLRDKIVSPSSGASFDPINKVFYKDGKLIHDPLLDSMAEKMFTNIQKPGKKAEFVPGDIGANGERVTATARARYDDVADPKERVKRNNQVFWATSSIFGTAPANTNVGIGAGNIKEGTPIVWTDRITPKQVEDLILLKDPNGDLLIKNADAFRTLADSINKGEIVDVTADVATSKTLSDERAYTVRGHVKILPFGIQQTPNGGPLVVGYNLSLLNDLINYQKDYTPAIKKSLDEFGIKTLDDLIPLVKEYFRNYSDGSPKPAADAIAAFAPKVSKESAIIMRDLLHLGGNIKPNEKKGGVYANKPTISLQEIPAGMVEAVTIGGQRRHVRFDRDRNVFSNFRLDAIYDASKYAPNGLPVQIGVDRSKIFPLARSNFSPGKGTVTEVVGDTKIITDTDIGARIVVPKGKKAQLFMDGKLVGQYADELDAVLASNKKSAKQGVQVKPRQQGQTSKEVETMRRNLMYGDLRSGKAAEELATVQKAIRRELRSPDDLPAWVESKNLRESTERKTQSEMRRRRKSVQKIREQSEQFWSGDTPSVVDAAEINAVAPRKKAKPEAVPPEVLEQIAMQQEGLRVTPPAGKKADALKNLPKPKKELKSFSELTPIIEAVQEVKAEPKKVTNLLLPEVRRVRSEATTMYPKEELAAIPSVFESSGDVVGVFQTEKGSVYKLHKDGTTTRNKAERNLPGHEGDKGVKERSSKTIFLDQNAGFLSGAGMSWTEGAKPRVVIKGDKASLTWIENGRRGAAPSTKDIKFYTEPAVGRYPLELWDNRNDVSGYEEAYSGQHAGNKIVSMGEPPKQKPAPKPEPKPAPEPVKPETTAPTPEVVTPKQDARIPQGFVIRRTPRGMFMVVLIAKNASVAVEESYEKAVQKARKRQKTSRSY